ncbi:PHD finger protein ALFIN-LIKE 7 [Frankliniella fusca]|uniref:PHD finger protein ALFIN-LIKE 7 n=1 Tax=Frankliniella fusca TaxID=407009 RepID=A0AAE1I382_9NEOP|nr:PHD finger protein ALFIN-LIKE 7 [Frankliniella fusca]
MGKHCFCLDRDKGFMICCDLCKRWFHGECVQITLKKAKMVDHWNCIWCSQSKQAEESLIEKFTRDMERFKSQVKAEMLLELQVMKDQILTDKTSEQQQISELEKLKKENDLIQLNLTHLQELVALKEVMISDLQREKEESQIVIAGLKTELENLKKENKQVALKQTMIDNLQREREKAQVEIEKLLRENTMKLVLKEQTKNKKTCLAKKSRLSLSSSQPTIKRYIDDDSD